MSRCAGVWTLRSAALAWHGPRGNLIVVADADAAEATATRLVDEVAAREWVWRIAMGPEAPLTRLRDRLTRPPLCWRDQVYYRGERATAAAGARGGWSFLHRGPNAQLPFR